MGGTDTVNIVDHFVVELEGEIGEVMVVREVVPCPQRHHHVGQR